MPSSDFPAFGQPVLAPAAGLVVRAHGRERDHKRRSSWPSLLYLFTVGLPFRLARFEVDGAAEAGIPANGRPFTVAAT